MLPRALLKPPRMPLRTLALLLLTLPRLLLMLHPMLLRPLRTLLPSNCLPVCSPALQTMVSNYHAQPVLCTGFLLGGRRCVGLVLRLQVVCYQK